MSLLPALPRKQFKSFTVILPTDINTNGSWQSVKMSVKGRANTVSERDTASLCEEASRKLITACEYFHILMYVEMEAQEVSTTAVRTRGGFNLQLRNTCPDFTFEVKPREADEVCVRDTAALFTASNVTAPPGLQ